MGLKEHLEDATFGAMFRKSKSNSKKHHDKSKTHEGSGALARSLTSADYDEAQRQLTASREQFEREQYAMRMEEQLLQGGTFNQMQPFSTSNIGDWQQGNGGSYRRDSDDGPMKYNNNRPKHVLSGSTGYRRPENLNESSIPTHLLTSATLSQPHDDIAPPPPPHSDKPYPRTTQSNYPGLSNSFDPGPRTSSRPKSTADFLSTTVSPSPEPRESAMRRRKEIPSAQPHLRSMPDPHAENPVTDMPFRRIRDIEDDDASDDAQDADPVKDTQSHGSSALTEAQREIKVIRRWIAVRSKAFPDLVLRPTQSTSLQLEDLMERVYNYKDPRAEERLEQKLEQREQTVTKALFQAHGQEIQRLRDEYNREKQIAFHDLNSDNAQHVERIVALTEQNQASRYACETLNAQIERLTNEHKVTSANRENEWNARCSQMEKNFALEKQQATQSLYDQLSNLRTELNSLQEATKMQLQEANAAVDEKVKIATQDKTRECEELREKLRDVELQYQRDIEAEAKRINDQWQTVVDGLTADINSIASVFNRTQFRGLTDYELSARFQVFANFLDDVTRVPWRSNLEGTWPVSTKTIDRAKNARKYKHHVLMSQIWAILWMRIFWTPFQLFLEEGDSFFREWTTKFPADGGNGLYNHWPKPTEASEDLRHEKALEYENALKDEATDETSRRRKAIYLRSKKQIARAIVAQIKRVAVPNDNLIELIDDFIDVAARLWLACGCQRYRVLFEFPEGIKDLISEERKLIPAVLLVRPAMHRVGDAHGNNLDNLDIIEGREIELSEEVVRRS